MIIYNSKNIEFSFGAELLFSGVDFEVDKNDKIGLVGVNGCGKTTLFKLMRGEYRADGGEFVKSQDTVLGYMEQHVIRDSTVSMYNEVLSVFEPLIRLEAEIEKLHGEIDSGLTDSGRLERQMRLQEKFEAEGGLTYRARTSSSLLGLGFTAEEQEKPVSVLSGGEKAKVQLAKLLLSGASLLLLDEPTNHLDLAALSWLEKFLLEYKGAYIVISHDRYFLDKVTARTFELENKRLRTYRGNYSAYITQRDIERLTQQRNYDYTTREIHRLEEVVEQQRRWKHKKNKKTHTLDNTRKAIERLEKTLVAPDKAPEAMRFKFNACAGGAQYVLTTKGLGMRFGENKLFENVDVIVKKGEKVFLLGPNGCGKTTFIKIILDIYKQTRGEHKIGENIHIGYYDQLKENLHKDKTVLNEVWDEYPALTQTEVRSALAVFLFKGEDVFKEIKSLSGGELARVELTKLLLKRVNFLIMDEPTNHLDITSREALETALSDYDGTMLMVSHDRYFINKLADRVLYLTPDGIKEYIGNYDDFLAARQEALAPGGTEEAGAEALFEEAAEAKLAVKKEPAGESANKQDYLRRKEQQSEIRKLNTRVSRAEERIEQLEAEIKQVNEELGAPENASDFEKMTTLSERLEELHRELDEQTEEWAQASEALEKAGAGQ